LEEEKSSRERRLAQLRATIEELWERLSVEHHERKRFLNSNRGCGMRTINEYEDELSRLNELKRQNLHLFVEEARITLQELWDALYFSEEEMLDFTPAFSDVCSDALLSAHEAEIARLEALKEQRLPVLSKIDRHRELIKERNDLQQSSQDASRLMARGNKGEKRDPGKLLREEKMRKRIQKELPKVEQDLKITLEAYEDEYGRPFLVHGERYLDELNAATSRGPPPRAKTPSNLNMPTRQAAPPKSTPSSRPRSGTIHGQSSFSQTTNGPPPSRAKTPVSATFGGSISRNPFAQSVSAASGSKSPSKIPARTGPPRTLGSPERRAPTLSRTDSTLSRADSMHSRGDSILSRGDSILSRADSMHSRPNSTLSRADSMHSRGYSTLSRADSLHSRADSLHSRANSTLSRADSMHSRADSTYSRPESSHSTTVRRMGPPIVPPARMKDLFVPPEPSEMPKHRFEFKNSDRSESLVRNTPLEDAYEGSYNPLSQTMRPSYAAAFVETPSLSSNSSRHLSTASSVGSGATAQSCSENWETFSEQSDEAPESDVDFQYHRNSQPRQYTPEGGLSSTPRAIQGKKVRGIRSVDGPSSVMEQANRTIRLHDSSEAAWTDDGETY
jgi:protein regulator of cytokinesis 1